MQFLVEIRLREGVDAGETQRLVRRFSRLLESKLGNMLFEEPKVHTWGATRLTGSQQPLNVGRIMVEHAHARRITFDPHMDMATKIDALLGVFA